jgi:hypothetical protein
MLYEIRRVDGSGRIASNDIVNALNWSSGSKLDVILTPETRPSPRRRSPRHRALPNPATGPAYGPTSRVGQPSSA